jgi:hypothetical protein
MEKLACHKCHREYEKTDEFIYCKDCNKVTFPVGYRKGKYTSESTFNSVYVVYALIYLIVSVITSYIIRKVGYDTDISIIVGVAWPIAICLVIFSVFSR